MQVLPELQGGGVERGTLEISRGLVARGHRSLVVSAGGGLVEQLEEQGGNHLTLDLSQKNAVHLAEDGQASTSSCRRRGRSGACPLAHARLGNVCCLEVDAAQETATTPDNRPRPQLGERLQPSDDLRRARNRCFALLP